MIAKRPSPELEELITKLSVDLSAVDPRAIERVRPLLERVETGSLSTPLLPKVCLELLQLARDPEVSFDKLALLAVTDPGVAARTMFLASSPLISSLPPRSVKDALVRLGLEGVRQIAFEVAFASRTLRRGPHVRTVERILSHARTASAVCRILSRELGVHPGTAALTGLLHALGGMVLVNELSATRTGKGAAGPVSGSVVLLCVRALHPWVSASIAAGHHLEPEVIEAIGTHHGDLSGAPPLTKLLAFAEMLSPNQPGARTRPIGEALERTGIGVSEERIRDRLGPITITLQELVDDVRGNAREDA